ncbi:hypothetical protein BV25DRAFT_1835929 [Artomyces pyxidatus]|uniref:Uncharacterized protein n=1 Tax=Artomyces pyxidatus TaxID=48021 RepID=A0ACB8TBW0_9AGAM|nr:hypothetical protein BV25DRAFT_1835929 [Artomyces pyxidatus]
MAPSKRTASDSNKIAPEPKRTRSSVADTSVEKLKPRDTPRKSLADIGVVFSQNGTQIAHTAISPITTTLLEQPAPNAVLSKRPNSSDDGVDGLKQNLDNNHRGASLSVSAETTTTPVDQTVEIHVPATNMVSIEGDNGAPHSREIDADATPADHSTTTLQSHVAITNSDDHLHAAHSDAQPGTTSDATSGVEPDESTTVSHPTTSSSDQSSSEDLTGTTPTGQPPSQPNLTPAPAGETPADTSNSTSPAQVVTSPSPEEIDAVVRQKSALLNYSKDLTEILPKILTHSDTANHVYVPTQVPKKLVWRDRHLSVARSKLPMKIWVVGTIRTLWFFDGKGTAQKRVTIRVIPLQDEAIESMTAILRKFTVPPTYAENYVLQEIHAAAFSSIRKRGTKETFGVVYPNVFDGREKFSFNRTDMPTIGPEFLHVGDTVIQEVTVGQYQTSSNFREQPELKDVTRVSFDLGSITLLSSMKDDDSTTDSESSGDDEPVEG